jgi:hypothetical protein
VAQLTSPLSDEKREEDEKDRLGVEDKGKILNNYFQLNLVFRRSIKRFRFSIKCSIKKSS